MADIDKLFEQLFTLLRDNNKSTQQVATETGKHRGSVDALTTLFRERPCFENEMHEDISKIKESAISQIAAVKDAAIDKIKDIDNKSNDKHLTVIVIISILNITVLGILAYFISTNPAIWEVIKIYLQK